MSNMTPLVKKLTEQGLSKKEIQREYLKQYREKNKDRIIKYNNSKLKKTRDIERHMINTYGITIKQFNSMLKSQKHQCAICGDKLIDRADIHIDHCHNTGVVRGLLCVHCNIALGHVKENISTLSNMINYLNTSSLITGIKH